MNVTQASRSGVEEGCKVNVHMGSAIVSLNVAIDGRVPDGCILIPAGFSETSQLGGPGLARVVKA
jgi:NADH-quinone oxidoreductase subunit G